MNTFSKYYHTIRYMRPSQIYGRVWYRLRRPKPDLRAAPPIRRPSPSWIASAQRAPSMVGPTCFRFLNETHDLADHGWDDPTLEKLWRYNLHYFDDLNARNSNERTVWHSEVLSRWVRENTPGNGTGWEPYPTSLRIVNWIKWSLAGNTLSAECLGSLAVQVRWLAQRIETHLLGNHLFSNGKALVFAGLFFEGPEADSWLQIGTQIIEREMPEQILEDGGHFERSPMYHALALEDVLDLCNVRSDNEPWRSLVPAMQRWLSGLSHPDGEIAFFNDAAIGIAPTPAELHAYAGRLGFATPEITDSLTQFASSGYVRCEHRGAVAILDVGAVGPDYLPAHAHADTLSFELSIGGQRVFVNSGTSCYGTGPIRLHERGTAAHNTVTVDGKNSSEVWSGFRVARRARPFDLRVSAAEISCSHDGYRRLRGKPDHTRTWRWTASGLAIEDRITGPFHQAVAHLHLHPSVGLSDVTHDSATLTLPDNSAVALRVTHGRIRVEDDFWAPEFGVRLPTRCLIQEFDGPATSVEIDWAE